MGYVGTNICGPSYVETRKVCSVDQKMNYYSCTMAPVCNYYLYLKKSSNLQCSDDR